MSAKNNVADVTAPTVQQLKIFNRAVEAVRNAYRSESFSSPFSLADELVKYREAFKATFPHKVKRLTNGMLADKLEIELSNQRIGALMATAEWFPHDCRDTAMSFKKYEEARKAEDNLAKSENREPRKGGELVAAMKKGEFADEKPAPKDYKDFVITVRIANGGNMAVDSFKLNGKRVLENAEPPTLEMIDAMNVAVASFESQKTKSQAPAPVATNNVPPRKRLIAEEIGESVYTAQ